MPSIRAKEISAFVTPSSLYSYKVMPFGLWNAPATFQRLMNMVVGDLGGCAVYLDNGVIFSDSWTRHISHIHQLFEHLAAPRWTVNIAKCNYACATVTYLRHAVGDGECCMQVAYSCLFE